jgi:two-component system, NarL family, sensor kinase
VGDSEPLDRLIAAEQDERRRIALFLHDGPVQNLAGIALMLDAALYSVTTGNLDDAMRVLTSALERQRSTIRELRDLSFALEPVVLRDQGFGPAVRALAERLGLDRAVQVDVDVAAGEALAEQAKVALYQLIREALSQAVGRRPTRISITVADAKGGGATMTVSDDGHLERRRDSSEAFEERARPLSGRVQVDRSETATTVTVSLPEYAVRT